MIRPAKTVPKASSDLKVWTMKVAPVLLFLSAAVSPLTLPMLFAQENRAAQQPDFGYLDVRRAPGRQVQVAA